MDLHHLEYIVAIADEENISKAAERLHVSQPTLSIYLSKLEAQLGIKLFQRTNNVLRITESGKLYAQACREIVKRRDKLYRELYGRQNNEIRLGVLSSSAAVFNQVFYQFKKTNPEITLRPIIHKSLEIYKMLLNGDIELGFATSYAKNPQQLYPEAKCTVLQSYELILCMGRENPILGSLHLQDGTLSELEYRQLRAARFSVANVEMIKARVFGDIFPRLGVHESQVDINPMSNLEFLSTTLNLENLCCITPYSHVPEDLIQIKMPWHPQIQKLLLSRKGYSLTREEKIFVEQVKEAFKTKPYYYSL